MSFPLALALAVTHCALVLMLSACAACCGGGSAGTASSAAAAVRNGSTTGAGGMRDITSLQMSQEMSPGWNLGNSLEAMPDETSWGNAATRQALMDAVRAAGFRTVRIPVAWKAHSDAEGNIDPAWMARVKQVVDYARQADLYVVLNTHWDGGWANNPTYARQASIDARATRLWTQIATALRDYDDHLLFAGFNEVLADGDYGQPTQEYCSVHNGMNQVFVDAVRATGGNNARRHLVVQAFNTGIDWALSCPLKLPADPAASRLFVEVHYYDPFDFTINADSQVWQWGSMATDPSATETWADESHVDTQFQKMKSAFVDKGVPVLLGEYGAMARTEHDPGGTYRTYWDTVITRSAVQHGMVPVYWDNGYIRNHEMGLFDRSTATQAYPSVINSIVNAR